MNSYNFSEDKERLLNTLARFDGNVSEDVVDSGKTKVHSKHYHTFFLHVLLENVCNDIEPNEPNREILFNEVCKRLSESKFLNESLVLDSLLPLRRKLAQQFFNFVKQVHTKVVPNPTESNITVDSFLEESDFSTKLELQYRYERNFEELEVIAKGGFGVVCKARHKVTDIVYAVKKVIFKYKSDSEYLKVIREAKSIAALNHPNIVSYNNAWIECLPPGEENDSDESGSKSISSEASSSSDESEVDKIEDHMSRYSEALEAAIEKENKIPSPAGSLTNGFFQRNYQHNKQSVKVFSKNFSFNDSTFSSSIGSKEGGDSKDISWDISENYSQNFTETCNCTEEISSTWGLNSLNVRVMLCIQMEYCDCDLRLWLDRRAEGQELPFNIDIMRIFKDILKGVTHIHSNNIIHRDLKVDIYSLGIIFFELLNTFSTKMEFSKAIDEMLKGHFPKEMEKNWPLHIHLVKNMVKRNPVQRMCAKDILSQLQSLESSESSEIVQLKVALAEKEEEIARLKALVEEQQMEKEEEIARLKALVEEQQSIINQRNSLDL